MMRYFLFKIVLTYYAITSYGAVCFMRWNISCFLTNIIGIGYPSK